MCPVGWQGQYRGKDRKACIRMEVICDDFLRIWHCMFGAPGSNNDIQIFEQSTHFNLMRSGRWPEIKPVIEIAGQQFDWFYYLCDGIYPRVRYLMSSSTDKEEKSVMFASHQEGARKSVERVFAVLFKRFRILDIPSRLWMAEDMGCILKCCVILHNIVVQRIFDRDPSSLPPLRSDPMRDSRGEY
jgi:Plant transposon protein